MNYSRRPDERRRRVMITAGAAAPTAVTASSRRRMEQMREAQRPQVAYGSRVRRCLRGRWFSLVPVHRPAFVKLLSSLALIVIVLVFFHDASARYATLADQPAWVDVLRINRYGSFGRYTISVLYLVVAGAAWLVYQLRRYRNDDFSGNYQLWQWIVASALVASVASAVPIVAMVGAGIDWALGQRAALSGKDWIELFLMVGGAILALRTVAEMWRYRSSTGLMVGGWGAMAIPTAADWNILEVENLTRWTIVTSAPLVAVALWLAGTAGYLRCLFREVRGIDAAPGLLQRLRVVADDWTSGREKASSEEKGEPQPRSRPWSVKRKDPDVTKVPKDSGPESVAARPALKAEPASQNEEDDAVTSKRRGWWPFHRAKGVDDSDTSETGIDAPAAKETKRHEPQTPTTDDAEAPDERGKRKWWPSLRRKPKATMDDATDGNATDGASADGDSANNEPSTSRDPESGDQATGPTVKKRRFGLGSMMRRRADSVADEADHGNHGPDPATPQESASKVASTSDVASDSGATDESGATDQSEDDIDWASMNKAERRRMRKQLKRGGKAA